MSLRRLHTVFFVLGTASLASAQSTTLLTLNGSSQQTDGPSLYAEISSDGRWVTWQCAATNLVPGDTNASPDVFLCEVATGVVTRVSVSSSGAEGDQDGLEPAISADGRYIAFFSFATNMVAGDMNAKPDIFVRDRVMSTTTRVSVHSSGVESDGGCRYPAISADGRYVAFESVGTNLVTGDTNGQRDVFRHDRQTATTVLASVGTGGQLGDGSSQDASVSPDGRYVAFESLSTNLVAGDTNGATDIFLRDMAAGTTVRVSVDSAGVEGDLESFDPAVSWGGRYVAFSSAATQLVPADTNGADDVFVRDMMLGATLPASLDSLGAWGNDDSYDPAITPDGRYVVFISWATNFAPGDTNLGQDIFLRDMALETTESMSVNMSGGQGAGSSFYPSVSAEGRFVAFDSLATDLVTGDANLERDIFLRDRGGQFRPFCSGDGRLPVNCPCFNTGGVGRGCANSANATGALLTGSGTTSPDAVVLSASGETPTALTIFLQGSVASVQGIVFGDGLRCVGGVLKRLYVKSASGGMVSAPGGGDPSITTRSAALGDPIAANSTRYYQTYFRDANPGFCPSPAGSTFNASSGIWIVW